MVEINAVSEVFIKIIYLAIQLPVLVPVFGDGHAYKHNPSQSHGRVFAELAHGIRQIAFANLSPLLLDVWSIRKLLVNTLSASKVHTQVLLEDLFYSFAFIFHIL